MLQIDTSQVGSTQCTFKRVNVLRRVVYANEASKDQPKVHLTRGTDASRATEHMLNFTENKRLLEVLLIQQRSTYGVFKQLKSA